MVLENTTEDRYERLIKATRGEKGSPLSNFFGIGSWRITEYDDNKGDRVTYIHPERGIIRAYKISRRREVA